MQKIKLGVAALNQTPLDWEGNSQRLLTLLQEARREGVQLLLTPELSLSGYTCEDAFLFPQTSQEALRFLGEIAPATKDLIVSIGIPFFYQGHLYNTLAILADQKLVGLVPKKHLANEGVHYEHRWFRPWAKGQIEFIENPLLEANKKPQSHQPSNEGMITKGSTMETVPLGDLYFNWQGLTFGYEICEEAWASERLGKRLAAEGVQMILNPSASHFALRKQEKRQALVENGSRDFSCLYAYSNLVGNESGRMIFDGGLLIADKGALVAESPRFSYKDHVLLIHEATFRGNDKSAPQTQTAGGPRSIALSSPPLPMAQNNLPSAERENATTSARPPKPLSFNEEFEQAVALGLFDYLRKSRSEGFAISLSGGVDSAVTLTLATIAFQRAHDELGFHGLQQKLSYSTLASTAHNLKDLLRTAIHTVYQRSEYSSLTTENIARNLANALGVSFSEWPIDQMISIYRQSVEKALGRSLDWKHDDLTLQNIQARVRGPGIWMLANAKNFLLLSTSNRSEVAVGYATMDGDTAGGLSPLAGIDKNFLLQWIRWKADALSPEEGGIPALKEVYQTPPTAELRPSDQHQQDEKDLMPYAVLELIERKVIAQRRPLSEVLIALKKEWPGETEKQLIHWLEKFCRLWNQTQWKRERYAPSFHLDEHSLDPKSWCRYPIFSKGFELQLKDLHPKN